MPAKSRRRTRIRDLIARRQLDLDAAEQRDFHRRELHDDLRPFR